MAYVKILKNNLYHNLSYFQNILGDKDKICVALKDNAYGHGICEIASLLYDYGVKHVFVKNDEEAIKIKNIPFDSILVMYGTNKINFNNKFHKAINCIEDLENLPQYSNIEIKIDTGMHRNGILNEEIDLAIKLVKKNKLHLKGIFTHFSSSDTDIKYTLDQEKNFRKIIQKFKKNFTNFRIHCSNTAATAYIDNEFYDVARIGIGIYGYHPIKQYNKFLKPVMELYANRISTRKVFYAETIGYNRKFININKKDIIVSTYDLGYGDGLFRINECINYKLPNGKEILGIMSMDSFTIEGNDNEVCFFNNVEKLASLFNTIPYEILVKISPFLKRVIE